MNKLNQITLNCYNITISYYGEDKMGASISSELKEQTSTLGAKLFNSAVGGLESMILAHFCAGVDVTTPAYIEGIESAYQAIANNLEDSPNLQEDLNSTLWEINDIQFPRLLSEITANIRINGDEYIDLKSSMGLDDKGINELFNRASSTWEDIKQRLL